MTYMGGERPAAKPPRSLMTAAEVALLFGVNAKTVTRWANAGRLSCVRTLGGHRRYRVAEILRLLGGERDA